MTVHFLKFRFTLCQRRLIFPLFSKNIVGLPKTLLPPPRWKYWPVYQVRKGCYITSYEGKTNSLLNIVSKNPQIKLCWVFQPTFLSVTQCQGDYSWYSVVRERNVWQNHTAEATTPYVSADWRAPFGCSYSEVFNFRRAKKEYLRDSKLENYLIHNKAIHFWKFGSNCRITIPSLAYVEITHGSYYLI